MDDTMLRNAFHSLLALAFTNGALALQRAFGQDDGALVGWVSDYDAMFAVWPDNGVESGYSFLPVKGWDEYKRGSASLRCNAIPCANRDAALALLNRFGNPAWLDECLPTERARMQS